MPFHKIRLMLLICGALLLTCTKSEAQVSLETVVDLAQRNSTAVRLAQSDVNRAMANLSESKDVIIPSLLFSTGLPAFPEVGFTGTPPSIWSATVQSLVFSIPQKHYIDAARLALQASSTNLKDEREQVALDASTAYIELDTVNQEMGAAQKEEDSAKHLVEIEQQRAEAGVDPMRDWLQARLTAAQIKLKREHLETRAITLEKQLAALTGLPVGSITTDHSSIPEIPEIRGSDPQALPGLEASRLLAQSKFQVAKGDEEVNYLPQLTFGAQYNRNTTILNSVNSFFKNPLPANNFSSGIAITIPIFDFGHRAKARESAADALRAKVEAEQADHQNDIAIAELNSSLQELTTQAEIASLQQQIAQENLKTVMTQLEFGNGSGVGPNAVPQLSPKAEELARIDESAKLEDSLDAGFDLAKARLSLLRALGHMADWLHELHSKQP